MRTCSIENCDKKHDARGYCKRHYKSFMKYGDAKYVDEMDQIRAEVKAEKEKEQAMKPKTNRTWKKTSREGECKVSDCHEKIHAKKLCSKHYYQLNKTGDLKDMSPENKDDGQCLAIGCKEQQKTRGYCSSHYQTLNRTGSPHVPKIVKMCGVEDCYDLHEARGLCHHHYNEWLKNVKKRELPYPYKDKKAEGTK